MGGEVLVGGVLSGTSADGIDVALFLPRFSERGGELRLDELGLVAFETVAFEEGLARRVRALLDQEVGAAGARVELGELARLDVELGRAFGAAAHDVARRSGVRLELLGSHGQTLWHHDGAPPRSSLQLGDGDFVARAAGCWVVSDFRMADLAAGGEGAPIGALVDPWLFGLDGGADGALCVLNLGGFGNLSLIDGGRVVASFDTGPAGALLDHFARRLLGRELDEGGAVARGGVRDSGLLDTWLGAEVGGASLAEFVALPPPKSTGRDAFGAAWCEELLCLAPGRAVGDLLATAVALVARSVAAGVALGRSQGVDVRALEVAGGGVHNAALMEALSVETGLPVRSSGRRGVDPDGREALIFGLLAAANVLGVGLPPGGRDARILGKLSRPPESGGGPWSSAS